MKNYECRSHTRYDCKYHVVFIPQYRRRKITGRFGGIWERFVASAGHLERIESDAGDDFSRAGEAEGKSHLGRAFEGRSRPGRERNLHRAFHRSLRKVEHLWWAS